MKSIDADIAYFEKCAADAPTKQAALVAFGIAAGLKIARNDLATTIVESADDLAKWTASALASGWQSEIYKVRDMDKWRRDIEIGLNAILKSK